MINSYYFDSVFIDAGWGFHHLVRRARNVFVEIISRIVSAVYSGVTLLAQHFSRTDDFIIVPKQIPVEGSWTGYVTSGTSITIPVNLNNAANSYVVVVIMGSHTPSAVTLNGVSATSLISASTNGAGSIFGIVPATTGSQNVIVGFGATATTRAVAYQVSGVNQSAAILAAQTATSGGATSLTTPNMVSSLYGLIIDGGIFGSGTISASSGQTTTTVNSIVTAGTLVPSSTTMTTTWATTVSSAGRVVAVSLNPA